MNAAEPTPRLRERPYLQWLEQSRAAWKAKAVRAREQVRALRRRVRQLERGRDRLQRIASALRRSLRRAARQALPKKK